MTSRVKNSPVSPFSDAPALTRTESVPLPEKFYDTLDRANSAPSDIAPPMPALKPPVRQPSQLIPTLSAKQEPGQYSLNHNGVLYNITVRPATGALADGRLASLFSSLVDAALADKPDFRVIEFGRNAQPLCDGNAWSAQQAPRVLNLTQMILDSFLGALGFNVVTAEKLRNAIQR